jgi:two-component system, chemotaxis family, protein-glutamate methylesterase/glutaminase
MPRYEAIAIGVSAGGLEALTLVIPQLPKTFSMPVMIAQHLHEKEEGFLAKHLNNKSKLSVHEAYDKENIKTGYVYIAPANYHLLVEEGKTFSLSSEGRINWSRPSIDALFQSAADAYGDTLIGVILTGANKDGSLGLKTIKENGGLTIAQDPTTAHAEAMPSSAIKTVSVDHVLPLQGIVDLLIKLNNE